jgi:hypothetical protein
MAVELSFNNIEKNSHTLTILLPTAFCSRVGLTGIILESFGIYKFFSIIYLLVQGGMEIHAMLS